jgi:hypothetical protein
VHATCGAATIAKSNTPLRIGTVYEESRIELRHWCYAFWRAATSKKGVSALEIKRHCQISYRSALFLMNRIRFAMAPEPDAPKLTGTVELVELDEVYVGPRRPRYKGTSGPGRSTTKTPVFCAVERGGQLRRRIVLMSLPQRCAKQSVRMSIVVPV